VTPFEHIGAEPLRRVIADFYDRVFADVMIGFMFAGKDKARLVQLEWELAARMLGGAVAYTGRPMRTAHANVPVFGGHFARRLQILRETMRDHGVPEDVQQIWLEHSEALRSQITKDKGSECGETSVVAVPPPPADPDARVKLGRR
jgi:hemoglobin